MVHPLSQALSPFLTGRYPAAKKPRRKRGLPRDSQRAKVYAWEKNFHVLRGTIAKDTNDVYGIVYAASRHLGIKAPDLMFSNRDSGGANANEDRIHFMVGNTPKLWVIYHELAHTFIRRKYGLTAAGHGPEWMSVYIYLMEKFMGIQQSESRRTSELYGIKVGATFRP